MPDVMIINSEPIDRMIGQIKSLESIDFAPLMEEWRGILEKDNEENIGIDGYGVPLEAVTYRPDPSAGSRKPINYEHIPPYDNLHSSHYRTLTGPALSPRGSDSRVTQFFRTRWERDEPKEGDWTTYGGWEDFKSLDNLEILPFHAAGPDHNPMLAIRDLLHIRPGALQRARQALISFINKLLQRGS